MHSRSVIAVGLACLMSSPAVLAQESPGGDTSGGAPGQVLTGGMFAEPTEGQVPEVIWLAPAGNPELASISAAKLISSFYEAGQLPTIEYTDDVGKPVSVIMREQDLFAGASFPAEVDSVACKLNPTFCTVGSDGRGIWNNKAGDKVVLPALKFTEFVEPAKATRPAGTSLRDFLTQYAAGECKDITSDCATETLKLNRFIKNADKIENSAVVLLPQVGWQTSFELPQGFDLPADVVRNTITIIEPSLQSVRGYPDEPTFGRAVRVYDLIGFPFGELENIEDVPPDARMPIKLAVVDGYLDEQHCDLQGQFTVLAQLPPPDTRRPPADCGFGNDDFSKLEDHGTHVAGIIGAKLNGLGVGGLEQFAERYYLAVDFENLKFGNQQQAFVKQLDLIKDVAVANLSWDYRVPVDQGIDVIRDKLEKSPNTLFVVAAGNSRKRFDGACDVRPACNGNLPNVLTVAGLDRDENNPQLWVGADDNVGSNFGPSFGIGAIAVEVISATDGNRVATATGTSQAAPQVSAAAALVMSAALNLFDPDEVSPSRIKNRLIYTTDLNRDLLESIFGGRLNIKRAMSVGDDRLTLLRDGVEREYVGRIVQLGNEDDEFVSCSRSIVAQRVTERALERMFFDKRQRKYILYFRSDEFDPASPLVREADCDLATRSNPGIFQTVGGESVEFKIRDIIDFTSSMH